MIAQQLDKLAEFQAQKDVSRLARQDEVNKVLTPEIKQAIEAIDVEFDAQDIAVDANIADLTAKIKDAGVVHGSTVKGTILEAVYNKGRTSWNNAGLDGYAVSNPEIEQFKKVGKPYVAIRKNK